MLAQNKVLFFGFGVCLAIAYTLAASTQCGVNEVFLQCGGLCATTCRTRFGRGIRPCPDICAPGCGCADGYLKNDNGKCVLESECSAPACNSDEEYKQCGTACQLNCDNKDDTCLDCTKNCVEGCFCKNGTVRESANSLTCIAPKSCPAKTCTGVNEVYDDCPPICPLQVCAAVWGIYNCPLAPSCCTPQCRCKPKYYRSKDLICISAQKCIDTECPANTTCKITP